jgi:acetyl-CoA carboxylase carboxyl transferase subunit alpha
MDSLVHLLGLTNANLVPSAVAVSLDGKTLYALNAKGEGSGPQVKGDEYIANLMTGTLSIIDTPGAYPGVGAEERHVAEAIAVNLREMAMLEVPTIAVVVGEGGSGGALGIGVTDRVLILENSYYSVISPEGCAAILWKDAAAAPRAAEALRLNAQNLAEFKIVEEVIPEPLGGAHNDPEQTIAAVKAALQRHLGELLALPRETLHTQRYERYRRLGFYEEAGVVKS